MTVIHILIGMFNFFYIRCVYTRANIVPAKNIPDYFSSDYIRVASTLHLTFPLAFPIM